MKPTIADIKNELKAGFTQWMTGGEPEAEETYVVMGAKYCPTDTLPYAYFLVETTDSIDVVYVWQSIMLSNSVQVSVDQKFYLPSSIEKRHEHRELIKSMFNTMTHRM
jgi:hypothetical protein